MNELGSDLRTQKVLEENMHRLNELEEKVKFIKTRSNITLSNLEEEKELFESEIADMRLNVISRLDDFEKTCKEKYNYKKCEIEKQIQEDVKTAEQVLSGANDQHKKLTISQKWATNQQLFITVHETTDKFTSYENELKHGVQMKANSLHWHIPKIKTQIESLLATSERNFSVEKMAFKYSSEMNANLKHSGDERNCFFIGVDIFDDGRIVCLDCNNPSLKLTNNKHQLCYRTAADDLRKIICYNDKTIIACFDKKSGITAFEVKGSTVTRKCNMHNEINVYNMVEYKNSLLLLCAKDNKSETDKFLDPSEIVFKLLDSQMSIKDFNMQTKAKISSWRGFVFDQQAGSFISVSEKGSSLIWFDETGICLKELSYDNTGRGGLSGLAKDEHGYLYAAATRSIFVIGKTATVLTTINTTINVYDIAVSRKGDKLVAVGHDNSVQIFVIEWNETLK